MIARYIQCYYKVEFVPYININKLFELIEEHPHLVAWVEQDKRRALKLYDNAMSEQSILEIQRSIEQGLARPKRNGGRGIA